MTETATIAETLRGLLEKVTQGQWHHCQAFQTVPSVKTIHGRVPAHRVDYVSTWPGPGTPIGHRVIIPMEGRESYVRSEDMAYIAACQPDNIRALLDERDRLNEECQSSMREIAAGRARAEAAEAKLWQERQAVASAIGTVRFMDPPDGGDVPLSEQVRRMHEALDNAEAEIASLKQALEWRDMESAPLDGKHCILLVPEPSGFIYTAQGAYQNGQWNAVHRDNVQPLAWMPNIRMDQERLGALLAARSRARSEDATDD